VQLFTAMNVTVVISDVDTVWLRRPFEYFKEYREADVLTSSDSLTWTHGDEGLEDAAKAGAAYNIGIMLFSPRAAAFAAAWVERIEADETVWDQNAFNWCAAAAPSLQLLPVHSSPCIRDTQTRANGAQSTLQLALSPSCR
jgi:Nucleotide-diphospho-sugar transferase